MVAPRAVPDWVSAIISSFNARLIYFFRIFLDPRDITVKRLRKATMHFGYNPRLCFSNSHSEAALDGKIQGVMGHIGRLAEDSGSFLSRLKSYREGYSDGHEVSHTIFRLSPTTHSRLLQSCHYDIVSQWALDFLLRACEEREADAVTKFYRQIPRDPWVAPLRGHLFEALVLNYLDGIDTHRDLSIRLLTGSDEITWTYRGPIPRVRFGRTFINEINEAVENKARIHLVPEAPNFAAADSIVYDPKEVLTFVQVTINHEHPIAVSGLKSIQKWLRVNDNTARVRPNQNQPWRFIFIVPEEMASSFTLQNMQGDTKTKVWAGKVEQYVYGFSAGSAIKTG
jgi:hypothetical protein